MAEANKRPRVDRARVADYFFGRNALIGLASLMLLVLAGYATWHGMRDFIIGVSTSPASQGQELPGGLSFSTDILVIAVVIALTFLMWLALRETFGAQRTWIERLITFPLYLFLLIWSVGFGYGFWWSLIAGEEATRTGLSGLQEDARDAGGAVAARLDAVRAQLDNVVTWSESQMSREDTSGGSCGTPSGAGQGPLYAARRGVRDQIASLRDGMTRSWFEPVQADVTLLQQSVAGLGGGTFEERQRVFEAKASEIRGRARSIAARSNELGKSTAAEMRALAQSVSTAPNEAGFSCYDPTLAQRLTQAALQADQPAELKLREAAFSEGPAGVANAIKNLWTNIGAYLSGLVSYVFSGGTDTGGETANGEPISGRDLIALLATLGVDLGLLALTALNPPASGPIRRDALAATQARLHLPSPSVVRQLTSALEMALGRSGADLDWVRKHFIHHEGASYFVIPNLYAVDQNEKEERCALAMNQLAGVLDDLNLIRTLSKSELRRFGREERRDSYSDLTPYADEEDKAKDSPEQAKGWWQARSAPATASAGRKAQDNAPRIRNHGLLSKSQRALDIAGWSKKAQSDVEIYRLVDTEGLTPLLMLLNEGTLAKGAEAVDAARKEQQAIAGGALKTEEPRQIPYKRES